MPNQAVPPLAVLTLATFVLSGASLPAYRMPRTFYIKTEPMAESQ